MEKSFKSYRNLSRLPLIPTESKRKLQDLNIIRNASRLNMEKIKESIRSHSQETKKLVIDMRSSNNRAPTPHGYYKLHNNENIQHRVINHKLLKINLGICAVEPIPIDGLDHESKFYQSLIAKEQKLNEFYKFK